MVARPLHSARTCGVFVTFPDGINPRAMKAQQ